MGLGRRDQVKARALRTTWACLGDERPPACQHPPRLSASIFFFSQREDFGWKERERENNKTSTGPRNVASSFKGGASPLLVRERRRFFFREEHQTCQISCECVIYPGLSLVSDCVFSYTYAVLRIESNLLTLPFLHKCQGFTARTCSCTK